MNIEPTWWNGDDDRDEPGVVCRACGAVVVCGPADFNSQLVEAIKPLPTVEVQSESFYHAQRGEGAHLKPGAWRLPNFKHRHSAGQPQLITTTLPAPASTIGGKSARRAW